MKKAISVVLAILMLLSLAACGGKASEKVKDSYPGTWKIDHLTIDVNIRTVRAGSLG